MEALYSNLQITDMVILDDTYIYTICREKHNPIKKCVPILDDKNSLEKSIAQGASILQESAGFYVFDLKSLFSESVVESYKIGET